MLGGFSMNRALFKMYEKTKMKLIFVKAGVSQGLFSLITLKKLNYPC